MIIEQVEALKLWLTSKLSPICDAEPSALAKYVCALVKKDKSEEELRDICLDQLDVFLQQKTKPFVNELFETLKSKSYIVAEEVKPQSQPQTTTKRPLTQGKEKDEPPKKKVSEVTSSAVDKENIIVKDSKEREATGDTANDVERDSKETPSNVKDTVRESKEPRALSREKRDREGERDRRDSWRDERNKDGIRDARDIIREREGRDTREVREPVREPKDRDIRERDRDYRRRRSRSRSYSPRRNYGGNDDRIRRRFDDRYTRYSPDRRWGRRRSWSRSPRRNRSPFGRPRSRSPRLRSRSPRLRSRSPRDRFRSFRSRSRSRSRSLRARSWSRPESGSRLVRSRSPTTRHPDSRGSTPILDSDYSALISSSTNELPSVSSTVGTHPLGDDQRPMLPAGSGTRSRCVDFEEKGFCMMGDMCPFDHGTDPVVVEDVPIPNVVPGAPPPPVEPYMPEAPGLRGPLPHFMRGMPPPHLRPVPPGMFMPRLPMERMIGPPSGNPMMHQPPPPVPDDDDLDPLLTDKEPSRIVIPAKRQYPPLGENAAMTMHMAPLPPRMPHINQHHHMFGQNPVRIPFPPPQQPQLAGPPRKSFDFNRLGGRGGHRQNVNRPFKTGNLTLEVRKIPAELNNIAKINEHFGKFGNLTNIQVKFQGDASAALITFSNNGEATAAYKSPEPVFNNRFIKLFWHNPVKSDDVTSATGENEVFKQESIVQRPGGRAGDGIDHPSLVLPVRSTIPPAHKLFLDNTKTSQSVTPSVDTTLATEAAKSSSIVYTSSFGHLKKTVFNATSAAGASPKVKASSVVTSPTITSKPSDFVSRIEAIKRAEESKKKATVKQAELDAKKQELLAKQIQQQKLLVETLDKKKGTMNEAEKASLLKSLKIISDAIDKVKYASGAPKKTTFQTPAPSQMKFINQDQLPVAPAPYSYGRGRGWSSSWSFRGKAHGSASTVGRTHLDNRPKTIEVKDFDMDEIEEVKSHFQKFGEIVKVDLVESVPSIFITYSTRPSAEMAVAHGRKFKNTTLTVRWNQMMQKLPRTESVQSSDLDDEDLSVTLGCLEEEALRNIGADKSEVTVSSSSSPLSKETVMPNVDSGDSRSIEEISGEAESSSFGAYKRTLSEDLLMGDEHNFKASYTDDEDDEDQDHITVTLSTTVTNPSWTYAGESKDVQIQPEAEKPSDLDNLSNTDQDG